MSHSHMPLLLVIVYVLVTCVTCTAADSSLPMPDGGKIVMDKDNDYVEEIGDEERLVSELMERPGLTVRPNTCKKSVCVGAVTVNVTYNIIQILAFSQAEETLSISGWFTLVWQDIRLRWSEAKFGNVKHVSLNSSKVWLPDVGVMNGKSSSYFDFSTQAASRVNVDSDGTVTWMKGVILDITCPLDVSLFPFDTQRCYIIFNPWQSSMQHLIIRPVQRGPAVDNAYLPNSNVSEWEINAVTFDLKEYTSQMDDSYRYIKICIRITRSPLYFTVLVLVPFSMLSVLACLIFTLEDTGDRLQVALSLVLSMTMYVVIVSSNAPRSMRTLPVLGIYLLDQLGLLCISTVMAVVNNKLRYHRPRNSPLHPHHPCHPLHNHFGPQAEPHYMMASRSRYDDNGHLPPYRTGGKFVGPWSGPSSRPSSWRRRGVPYNSSAAATGWCRKNTYYRGADNEPDSPILELRARNHLQQQHHLEEELREECGNYEEAQDEDAMSCWYRNPSQPPVVPKATVAVLRNESGGPHPPVVSVEQQLHDGHSGDKPRPQSPCPSAASNATCPSRRMSGHAKKSRFRLPFRFHFPSSFSLLPTAAVPHPSLLYAAPGPYEDFAGFLDRLELVLYLVLSAVNAIVCLFIVPRMAQTDGP